MGPTHRHRRSRTVVCLALAALAALPALAQAAAPHNDAFADAQTVRIGDRVAGSLVDATSQTGEPATSSPSIDRTVWYRLTSTATETVRVGTCHDNPYAELQVFTGAAVDALTEVAHTDSGCTGGGTVYFTATAGTAYHVRVAGYDFGADIALTVARPQPPANDMFAQAQPVGLPAHITATTVDATVEPGEPEPSAFGSGHSVWYRVTATTRDSIKISTCTDYTANAIVSVYTGSSVGALTDVAFSRSIYDVCGLTTAVVITPVVGATYFISVRGSGTTSDEFTVDMEALASPGPGPILAPPNPKCPFELAAPGSVTYRGTHSGGGEVCITMTPDFKGITWFNLVDPPRGLCDIPFAVERLEPAAPIANRTFALKTASARVTGSFPYGRGAKGTFQAVRSTENGTCVSRELTWSAVTAADPPWLHPDTTPPALTLSGARTQRPLSSRRVVVGVRCPKEACAASASMAVAGITLKAAPVAVARNRARTLRLALSANARRAVRRALRSRRSIRARVVVIARDADGNARRSTRTITLRR